MHISISWLISSIAVDALMMTNAKVSFSDTKIPKFGKCIRFIIFS